MPPPPIGAGAEGEVVVPRDDLELLGLGVVVEVRVVAGAVDVVEVVEQVLHREVRGERVDVEPVAELGRERRVVRLVDELQELDQRGQVGVVRAGLLVEHLVVRRRVVAAVAPVAGALGLVERTGVGELLGHPLVVGAVDHQAQHLARRR